MNPIICVLCNRDIDDIDFNYKLKFDVYLKHNGDKEC